MANNMICLLSLVYLFIKTNKSKAVAICWLRLAHAAPGASPHEVCDTHANESLPTGLCTLARACVHPCTVPVCGEKMFLSLGPRPVHTRNPAGRREGGTLMTRLPQRRCSSTSAPTGRRSAPSAWPAWEISRAGAVGVRGRLAKEEMSLLR